ncbi:uncharacterized protein LOC144121885 [Amblyomma americanum]
MSVRLATQLFSRGTAIGIRIYREGNAEGMIGSERTEAFTKIVNDLFDALNMKLPERGIKRHSKEIQRHFGLVRSFEGDESHPTVVNFTQIFRLLSLYTPIKTALRGSVQGVVRNVLVGVQDTLKMTRAVHRTKHASLHGSIQQKLMEMTSDPARIPDQQDDDHCYFKGDVDQAVVYYLSGYVVHKFEKLTACLLCLKDISSPVPIVGSDAYLTTYRSFKEGCMKHPTVKMLTIMKTVNEVVSATLYKAGLCTNIFWKVLEELEKCNLACLGCAEHMSALTCQILNFIIVTRMHFLSRDVNHRLESKEKVAVANKKARLL